MSSTKAIGSVTTVSRKGAGLFRMRLRTREALAAYLFLAPFVIFFLVFIVRAVVQAVNMSFYDWQILKPVHPYIGLANYNELFGDYVWWIAVKNTLVFTVLTVIGTTVVAVAAAIAVTQPVKGNSFFRVL